MSSLIYTYKKHPVASLLLLIPCVTVSIQLISLRDFLKMGIAPFFFPIIGILTIPFIIQYLQKFLSHHLPEDQLNSSLKIGLSPLACFCFMPFINNFFLIGAFIFLLCSFFFIILLYPKDHPKPSIEPTTRWWISWLALSIFTLYFILSAWIAEDAYITFRTVDNWVSGFGLRWNVTERTQAYTHPLWMMVISAFYAITGEIYFTVISISFVLCVISFVLVFFKMRNTTLAILPAFAGIVTSKAFMDYTSSGLENPLSYFLLVSFGFIYLKKDASPKIFLWLLIISSLAMLNRFDHLILYLFPLAHVAFKLYTEQKVSLIQIVLTTAVGFTPMILWEIFSVIYYGVPFSNTAYAKLNTGIMPDRLRIQGLWYFYNSIRNDTSTIIVLIIGSLAALRNKCAKPLTWAIGLLFYAFYILHIGGGFMSGRFLAILVLGFTLLIISHSWKSKTALFVASFIVFLSLLTPRPVLLYNNHYEYSPFTHGIADERGYYYQCSGLLTVLSQGLSPNCKWVADGKQANENQKDKVVVRGNVGFYGFYAGPEVYIIDSYALTDPLLSHLPVKKKVNFRIGHFKRRLPRGYVASRETNQNLIDDDGISELYDGINIITKSDELFSKKRWAEIWKLNTGYYHPYTKNF